MWLRLRIALIQQFSATGGIEIFVKLFSHRSPVPSNVSSKKTRSNMTSVLFKKEYVTQDLYIILYIDLEGNEAQRN